MPGSFFPTGLTSPNAYDTTDFTSATSLAGIPDVTAQVQAAVNAAALSGSGGIVQLPMGVVRINGVNISTGGITIQGYGFEEYDGGFGVNSPAKRGKRGTYILHTDTSKSVFSVLPTANFAAFKDLAFIQPQTPEGAAWAPVVFQPCIFQVGPSSGSFYMERVLFWGVYAPMNLGNLGGTISRATLRDVSFASFTGTGSRIAGSQVSVENCSFLPALLQGNPNQQSYIQNNARALAVLNCIDGFFHKNRFYNHATGLSLRFPGITAATVPGLKIIGNAFVGNINGLADEADNLFNSQFGAFRLIGNHFQGPPASVVGASGLFLNGSDTHIDIDSCVFTGLTNSAVVILKVQNAQDVRFGVINWFDNWGLNPDGTNGIPPPAVYSVAGNNILLSNNSRFTNANTGAQTGGGGTFTRY